MLTYTDDETGVSVSVKFDRWDALQADRARWYWSVNAAGTELGAGDDLTTVGDPIEVDAMRSLLTFLSAWDEAGETGENSDLFPASMRPYSVNWQTFTITAGDAIGADH